MWMQERDGAPNICAGDDGCRVLCRQLRQVSDRVLRKAVLEECLRVEERERDRKRKRKSDGRQ
jgi:hypothetical protein